MPYTAALRVLNSAIQEGSTPSIAEIRVAILNANLTLEWRNWQTHGTQNPATFTGHEGSTPSSSTINSILYGRLLFPANPRHSRCVQDCKVPPHLGRRVAGIAVTHDFVSVEYRTRRVSNLLRAASRHHITHCSTLDTMEQQARWPSTLADRIQTRLNIESQVQGRFAST